MTNNNKTTISDVIRALYLNLPNLQPDPLYTLEELASSPFWQSVPKSQHNHLGTQFKAQATQDQLPVAWIDRRSDNCQIYQLK